MALVFRCLLIAASLWALGRPVQADYQSPAVSEDPSVPAAPIPIDKADVAWLLISSALVLMMTAPGLAMFYGGLVRKKNILGVMMQCFSLVGVMSLVWALWGYSLTFSGDVAGAGLIGDFNYAGLNGVLPYLDADGKQQVPQEGTVPKSLHMMFQMMFFIITPGLICGAYAERMKFSSMVLFSVLWGTLIYCPVAHWVWSSAGWCSEFNQAASIKAIDFAGGTVVHITSGLSALVCALFLGKRIGFGHTPMPPHNLTYTAIGAGLLWMGWFGFNGGSAMAADARAVNACLATHLAAAAGVVAWSGVEWLWRGKPTILGACSGGVAGLVCITPACGSVTTMAGILLGLAAGIVCLIACTTVKHQFGYDDSLDAFGVHGVGGILGAVLTGVFATRSITGPTGLHGLLEGDGKQLLDQCVAIGAAGVLAVVGTALLLMFVQAVVGLRVDEADELQGLDLNQHGEEGYIFL